MSFAMLAGQITGPRKVELIEVPRKDCGEGEVTVRLELACLCGSDLPYFAYDFDAMRRDGAVLRSERVSLEPDTADSLYPLQTGLSLHECVGTVIESRSDRHGTGDFVLALPFSQVGFFGDLTLPEDRVFPLPTAGASKAEILLCQPLGTVLYALRKMPELQGKTVAVVGQGPIGLMIDAVLAMQGAERIIGIEKVPERLALAKQMGAHETVNAASTDAVAAVADLTNGTMPDIVVEAAGHADLAVDLCVKLACQDGYILQFGVVDTMTVDGYPLGTIFNKNLTISNSVGASKAEHFLPAAELIASGRIDVSPLLTHRFPVSKAQEAYETFVDRKDGAVKVLLEW